MTAEDMAALMTSDDEAAASGTSASAILDCEAHVAATLATLEEEGLEAERSAVQAEAAALHAETERRHAQVTP